MSDKDAKTPNDTDNTEDAVDTPPDEDRGGGLEPKDSRNVTGTAVTEDGRWTGAAVRPEEGPSVPKPKK